VTELTPAVAEAVAAVQAHFAGKPVEVSPDGGGGAFLIIEEVDVGPLYTPSTTWLGFHINATYPASDVYPHFVGALTRTDGSGLGEAIAVTTWRDRPALQLSRKSNRWNSAIDNAANKAERVLRWLTVR
jgi:hypothetical protein